MQKIAQISAGCFLFLTLLVGVNLVGAHPAHGQAIANYNRGVEYYQKGQFEVALAFFERAQKLNPWDSDIRHNLAVTEQALQRKNSPAEEIPDASSFYEKIADRVPLDETRVVLGVLVFFTVAFWFRHYLRSRNIKSALTHPSGLLCVIAVFLTLSLYAAQRLSDAHPLAVSLPTQTIRSGPGPQFLEIGTLSPGARVRLTDLGPEGQAEGWHSIRFISPDGQVRTGWVPDTSLVILF